MTRFALSASGLALAAVLALPAAVSPARAEMTPAQKSEVEALVKAYILEHGEVVIQSVDKYQQKQEEAANKDAEVKSAALIESFKNEKDLAETGNPKGDVTVVEFFDYNCGYCKKAYAEILTLLKDDKNVRVVFYDMPILGPASVEDAKWSLAAKRQGKYFEFHKALMEHPGDKDEAALKKLAKDAGLDADRLAKDKADPAIEEEIQKHVAMAKDFGIQGTPAFMVNEKIFRGYIPYDAMKSAVAEVRAKKPADKKK